MDPLKRLLRSAAFNRWICRCVAAYIRFVWRTSRWQTEHGDIPEAYWQAGKPFILCFWHGRLLMMPKAWPETQPMNMLISGHRDGRIIADAIAHFGLNTIIGSAAKSNSTKAKGGMAALRAMVRSLSNGEHIGVTPDGPRGPAMRASPGIIAAARLSGAPILPLAYATTRRRILGSWDRFHLALPFSRGVFLWGEPLFVAPDADAAAQEAARQTLEARMNELSAAADRRCGHRPVPPSPEPWRP
ncbi:MAG TPA: lysophospholipid acyltransferase family protein [Stellaceae bacterium]|nr:lysophospholipid acyltransferase family protein [Stellaceae bacterium]